MDAVNRACKRTWARERHKILAPERVVGNKRVDMQEGRHPGDKDESMVG
jgi:hypothetical protein